MQAGSGKLALASIFSCWILGVGVHSPLTFLVKESRVFGAVSLVSLKLMEVVTYALLCLKFLRFKHNFINNSLKQKHSVKISSVFAFLSQKTLDTKKIN